jgi:hypothetical protein
MRLSNYHRELFRGILAGAVVLTVGSACSRSDRADAGRDTTLTNQTGVAGSAADSQSMRATQPTAPDSVAPSTDTGVSSAVTERASRSPSRLRAAAPSDTQPAGYQAMGRESDTSTTDTASTEMSGAATDTSSVPTEASADSAQGRTDTVAVGDSAEIGKPGERVESTEASQQANADTLANRSESDRIRPPEDSSEAIGVATGADSEAAAGKDSTVSGAAEMARDTSTVLAQADTAGQAPMDTAGQNPSDTAAVQARVDTTTSEQQTEVAVETPADSATVVGDSAETGKPGERLDSTEVTAQANSDTLANNADRIRPPEDSTELVGKVNTDRADARSDAGADAQPVGAAGVQSTGNIVTGAEAVALMTREGRHCEVLSGDKSRDAQWDLAGSPASMNPCGTGTMTLPRVQTGEE